MAWQTQLITLYLTVCEHYKNGLCTSVQRYSAYTDLSFSDEEVITLYLFGIMDKRHDIKSICSGLIEPDTLKRDNYP